MIYRRIITPDEILWQIFVKPFRPIVWFIQRGVRGYSDRDTWNLSYYLAFIMKGSLKTLASSLHGSPCRWIPNPNQDMKDGNPYNCDNCTCFEEWQTELQLYARKFQLMYDQSIEDEGELDEPIEKGFAAMKRQEKNDREAMDWLAKKHGWLWD